MSTFRFTLTTGFVALLFMLGCGDNPVSDLAAFSCEHVDADGLLVEDGLAPRASQWLGSIAGELVIESQTTSGPITVTFLDPDSSRIYLTGGCPEFSLGWTVADPSIVDIQLETGEIWKVRVSGLRSGSTSVQFYVRHVNHPDFTSLPLPVRVIGAVPDTTRGVHLSIDDSLAARCWRENCTGMLSIDSGDPGGSILTSWFLNQDSLEYYPPQPEYLLSLTAADPSVVLIEPLTEYTARITGLRTATTEISVILMRDADTAYATTIPLEVLPLNVGAVRGLSIAKLSSSVYSSWSGVDSGGLSVSDGLPSLLHNIRILGADSLPLNASAYQFVITSDVPSRIGVISDSSSLFRLTGSSEGTASIDILVYAAGQLQGRFDDIPVQVTAHTPWPYPALQLTRGLHLVASNNYDPLLGPNRSVGTLVLESGVDLTGLTVALLDSVSNELDQRLPIRPEDDRYSVSYVITDPTIATVVPESSPWSFSLRGESLGSSLLTVSVRWNGADEFAASFRVITRAPSPNGDANASFMMTRGGVWYVHSHRGKLLNESTRFCTQPIVGDLRADAGELTDLYSFRIPGATDSCQRVTPSSSSRSLAFEFADPERAAVLNHPVHWGEYMVFHLYGPAPTTTTVRVHFVRSDNTIEFTSPPIPVTISP